MLNSQRILSPRRSGKAIEATLEVIRHLGYIQIDTISVVARAHHHTLWNRNPRYQSTQLDQLLEQRKVFEYWSHAAAYLPIEDYKYCLFRMQVARGERGGWLQCEPGIKKQVLKRIRDEGPLMARDFTDPRPGRAGMWDWKPAKIALEQLFMEGQLMTARRQGFHKVYDLTERVLPESVDTRMPNQEEYARHLIHAYLKTNGLGQVAEFGYLRKGIRPTIQIAVDEMLEQGELQLVKVKGEPWLMLPEAINLLEKSLTRSKAKILSPFDNMVIQRKRMRQLFDFDYLIECYVPGPKRQYGYFCLPVVWQGQIVARMDCKAHRDKGVLEVRSLHLEQGKYDPNKLADALISELDAFSKFNGCNKIKVGKVSNRTLETLLRDHSGRRTLGQPSPC